MDAVTDPGIETITVMTSARIGKTEILNNALGYHIDQDPCPVLMVQPTLDAAQHWSKDQFAPMLRDTPCLAGKVGEPKAKDSSCTILHKTFPGGFLDVTGANSPIGLRRSTIRVLLLDEVDGYPSEAGIEGDPVKLAKKRTITFWNRKIVETSTPTVKGISRIESSWEESDQRRYHVPCISCGAFQVLHWGQLKFDKVDLSSIYYECEQCHAHLTELDKPEMILKGKWIAKYPERMRHAGFHINELYSPWSTWRAMVEEFLEAKKRPETLKVWVNTALGETWEEEESYSIDIDKLAARIEDYVELPAGVVLLTAGIDVQDDRLECLVKGWGIKDESWFVDYKPFYGSPGRNEVWDLLDTYLSGRWKHELGVDLGIVAVCVDSGGHFTQNVYQFTKRHQSKRFIAVKGLGGHGKPFIGKPSYNNRRRALLIPLGVDTAKELVYARLEIEDPGPGFMHFNQKCDDEYFKQLTAERHITKYNRGFPTKVWVKKEGQRNEALDCEVYALAAVTLLNANMEVLARQLAERAAQQRQEVEAHKGPVETPRRIIRKLPVVGGWRVRI
jgi:phage terminase large subunit GpA-like protein